MQAINTLSHHKVATAFVVVAVALAVLTALVFARIGPTIPTHTTLHFSSHSITLPLHSIVQYSLGGLSLTFAALAIVKLLCCGKKKIPPTQPPPNANPAPNENILQVHDYKKEIEEIKQKALEYIDSKYTGSYSKEGSPKHVMLL